MVEQAEVREQEDRFLVELTDLAMGLARDLAGRAKKAETLEDAERFTAAFDRMSRSVRLSIALRRRLEREAARDTAEHHAEVIDLRKSRLRARLRSEIRESDAGFKAALEMERELDATLAEDALYQSFIDLPLDEAISKLRGRLGLPDPPPLGEVDRAEGRETEGVRAPSALRGLQPPQSPAVPAPPAGEHLVDLRPAPS